MINRRQNNFIIIELLRDYILEQKLSSAILDYFKNPNFLCKVRWFNLSPLMFEILKESELPESVYLTLQKDYEITLCRNLRALHSLGILFESLENENIKTVNLRGLVSAYYLYGDINVRPMSDIDICFNLSDMEKLQECLKKIGFKFIRKLRCQLLYEFCGMQFEFHWNMITPRGYNKYFLVRINNDNRDIIDIQGIKVYKLKDEQDLFLTISHTFLHHDLEVLKSLIDILLYFTRKNIKIVKLEELSQKYNMQNELMFTIGFIEYLFEIILCEKPKGEKNIDERILEAYSNKLFGIYRKKDYFISKKNKISLCDNYYQKMNNLIRIISIDEYRKMMRKTVINVD